MATIPLWQVDAFTDRPFSGNPAAVCYLDTPRDGSWLQTVAAEMNLSETAFVRPIERGYELRWFTPKVEVDLCGHATLASAHVLWAANIAPRESCIEFHTRSGKLTAVRSAEWIELDFPANPPEQTPPMEALIAALVAGCSADVAIPVATYYGRTRFDVFVEFSCAEAVRQLQPDPRRVANVAARGVIVTAASDDPRFDFISRFFAPNAGIDEDPVTGSAHCALGPYWGARLGKSHVVGYQASARGGVVRVHNRGDRVTLIGQAVTVFEGQLV
jgi:PhzF family phenazine biosynthesis protein